MHSQKDEMILRLEIIIVRYFAQDQSSLQLQYYNTDAEIRKVLFVTFLARFILSQPLGNQTRPSLYSLSNKHFEPVRVCFGFFLTVR